MVWDETLDHKYVVGISLVVKDGDGERVISPGQWYRYNRNGLEFPYCEKMPYNGYRDVTPIRTFESERRKAKSHGAPDWSPCLLRSWA